MSQCDFDLWLEWECENVGALIRLRNNYQPFSYEWNAFSRQAAGMLDVLGSLICRVELKEELSRI